CARHGRGYSGFRNFDSW
nr:immunoglobulin heavy chain junction region [Macaca mulatta]